MTRQARCVFFIFILLGAFLVRGVWQATSVQAAEYSCRSVVSPDSQLTYSSDPSVDASLNPGDTVTVEFTVSGATDLRSQYSVLWLSLCNEESNGALSCGDPNSLIGRSEWREIQIGASDIGSKTAAARLTTDNLDTDGSRYKITLLGQTLDGQRKELCSAKDDAIRITRVNSAEDLYETNREQGNLDEFRYCDQISDLAERQKCATCIGNADADTTERLYTAFGCIRIDNAGLASDIITLMIGISGTIALLIILVAAFILSISQGEMKHVKQAKDLITAAVSGLFFIIFSIIILEFVGVTILRIPGLG